MKFSKESKVSIAVGLLFTGIVILCVWLTKKEELARTPNTEEPLISTRGSSTDGGAAKSDKQSGDGTCSLGDFINQQSTASKVAFLNDLKSLHSIYETSVFEIPPTKLDFLLATNAEDAEAYLLDEFSPALQVFYEKCVKVSNVRKLLDSSLTGSSVERALLMEALQMNPPQDVGCRIVSVLAPYDSLFTHVRANPVTTITKLPSDMLILLTYAPDFAILNCPSDLEALVQFLFERAQLRRRIKYVLDTPVAPFNAEDAAQALADPEFLGLCPLEVERLRNLVGAESLD